MLGILYQDKDVQVSRKRKEEPMPDVEYKTAVIRDGVMVATDGSAICYVDPSSCGLCRWRVSNQCRGSTPEIGPNGYAIWPIVSSDTAGCRLFEKRPK